MIARAIAWIVVIVIAIAAYRAWDGWKNPWTVVESPVIKALPKLPPGCAENKECTQ